MNQQFGCNYNLNLWVRLPFYFQPRSNFNVSEYKLLIKLFKQIVDLFIFKIKNNYGKTH